MTRSTVFIFVRIISIPLFWNSDRTEPDIRHKRVPADRRHVLLHLVRLVLLDQELKMIFS